MNNPTNPCPGCGQPKIARSALCMTCYNAARMSAWAERIVCPGCGGIKKYDAKMCKACRYQAPTPEYAACPGCGGRMGGKSKRCQTCVDAEYNNPDRPIPMSPIEQQRYGAIVTLENQDSEILVIHHSGRIQRAVERAYAEATSVDPTFRIISVSTPTSIFEDLQGARRDANGRFGAMALYPEQRYGTMLHERLRR